MDYNPSMDLICGVDEAGRGPLAGPVTAAAVILPEQFPFHLLNDSKKMSAKQREEAAAEIRALALDYSVGWVWPEEIDQINIHHATLLAMRRALEEIKTVPDLILVDGKFTPQITTPCHAIIKGDTYIKAIQAASIIAKTARDRWMKRYSWIEPEYGFDQHKGYPTKEHRIRIKTLGPSPIHRKSFKVTFPS